MNGSTIQFRSKLAPSVSIPGNDDDDCHHRSVAITLVSSHIQGTQLLTRRFQEQEEGQEPELLTPFQEKEQEEEEEQEKEHEEEQGLEQDFQENEQEQEEEHSPGFVLHRRHSPQTLLCWDHICAVNS